MNKQVHILSCVVGSCCFEENRNNAVVFAQLTIIPPEKQKGSA